jgi:putative peptidoglycan lipid II flippase
MLDAALCLAVAARVAIGIGAGVRVWLLQFLSGTYLPSVLTRATVLCTVGLGIYFAMDRLFGIRELARLERMLLRRLGLRRAAPHN